MGTPWVSERIRAVLGSGNLRNNEFPCGDILLKPQLLDLEVSNLADSLAKDDTSGCRRVRPQLKGQVVPQASSEPLDIESFHCPLEGRIQFRLTRGQGDIGLEFAPPANGVAATADNPTTSALASRDVSSPVRVSEDSDAF